MSVYLQSILDEAAERYGWGLQTQLELLVEYIDNQGDDTGFTDFLARAIHERGDREVTPEMRTPSVQASAHTDDWKHEVVFDAAPWLARADDEEIAALDKCGFAQDYAADRVAEESAEWVPALRALFDYTGPDCGFEVVLDLYEAQAWVEKHRPHLVTWPRATPAIDSKKENT